MLELNFKALSDADLSIPAGWLTLCHACDLPNRVGDVPEGGTARCPRCGSVVYKRVRDSLDRTLAREKDFAAACGSEVRIETRQPVNGRRRFRGRLTAFDGDIASVEVDGLEFEVPFSEIATANSIYEFTRDDFARSRETAMKLRNEKSAMERA